MTKMMTPGKNEQSNGLVVMTPVMTLGKKVSKSSMSEGVDRQTTWMEGKKTSVIEAMAEQSNMWFVMTPVMTLG